MSLATLAEVKAALGITDADSDDQITALLEPLSAAIEKYAGRKFENGAVTEFHNGGEPTISLREFPVTVITTVTDLLTGEVLDSSLYSAQLSHGLLRRLPRGTRWAAARRAEPIVTEHANVASVRWEIVYTAGVVPEDVKLALYDAMQSTLTSQGGFSAEKDGDYSYVRTAPSGGVSSVLPATTLGLLASYRTGVFI